MTTSARDDVVIVPYEVLFEFFPRIFWLGGKSPSQPVCFLEAKLCGQRYWNGSNMLELLY